MLRKTENKIQKSIDVELVESEKLVCKRLEVSGEWEYY